MPSISDAVATAKAFAADDNITYSTPARTTIYTYYFLHESNNGACDCSSLVFYALYAGGFDPQNYTGGIMQPFSTGDGTELNTLDALGFKRYNFQTGLDFKAGDIIWRDGHTAILVESDGTFSGTTLVEASGNYIDSSKDVRECPLYNDFTYLFRYEGEDTSNKIIISLAMMAGLLGNALHEGAMRPTQAELISGHWDLSASDFKADRIGGGIFQWTNVDDSKRLYNLLKYADYNTQNAQTVEVQATYLVQESRDNEQWIHHDASPSYTWTTLESFLLDNSSDDPEYYCWAFANAWERGVDCYDYNSEGMQDRRTHALEIYDYLQEHYLDEVEEMADVDSSGHVFTWTDIKRNNAVYFFQVLNGYLGGYIGTHGNYNARGEVSGDKVIKTDDNNYYSTSDLAASMGLLIGLLAMGSLGGSSGPGKYKNIGKRGRNK